MQYWYNQSIESQNSWLKYWEKCRNENLWFKAQSIMKIVKIGSNELYKHDQCYI